MKEPKYRARDISLAFGLLTRLPAGHLSGPLERAGWAFPLVGLVCGMIQAMAAALALWMGFGPLVAAALAIFAGILTTGAMHEDGLADCADSCGTADRKRRLEIMRDSRIGTYGTIALIAALTLRWAFMVPMFDRGIVWMPLILAAMASRAAVTAVMSILPPARNEGLGHMVSGGDGTNGVIALSIAGAAILLILPGGFAPVAIWLLLGIGFCLQRARALFGGQTGDVLGAVQVICELVVLAAVSLQLDAY